MDYKPKMKPNEYKAEIGNRLRDARLAMGKGWTLKRVRETLRDLLGDSRIGNYEQGTRRPGPYEINVLANLYGVRASYLMCLDEGDDMTKEEVELLRDWRALPEKDRMAYKRRIAAMALMHKDPVPDERMSAEWKAPERRKDESPADSAIAGRVRREAGAAKRRGRRVSG